MLGSLNFSALFILIIERDGCRGCLGYRHFGSALGRVTQPDDRPPLWRATKVGCKSQATVLPAVGYQNLLDNSCVIIGAEEPGKQRGKLGTKQKQVAIQAVLLLGLGGGAQVCDSLLAGSLPTRTPPTPTPVWPG